METTARKNPHAWGDNYSQSRMPDAYDRQLANLHDLPDVVKVKASTVRVVPPLGIGGTQLFAVQTVRQVGVGDSIFLEMAEAGGLVRLVLPPAVSALIARQRETLTGKARSKAAATQAADRKARGIRPGFQKAGR